jgi:predicted O-methyltransferase YrrM
MHWKYFDPLFEYEKWKLEIDAYSGWVGHKYFIYDFIRNLKPQVVVELGTHYGTSFFSMCQAAKDSNLKGKLYAIDLWQGDKHAGFYDRSVLSEVKRIASKYYKNLKYQLLQKSFDEALKQFPDNSIDLLHIDGLHTYKAVKHDFLNWESRVKKDGLIILHDISETKDDFGVYKLWKEIKRKYRTLEFYHSHGLGIVFKKPEKFIDFKEFEEIWQRYYATIFENRVLNKNKLLDGEIKELIGVYQENKDLKDKKKIILKDIESLNKILSNIESAKFYKLHNLI